MFHEHRPAGLCVAACVRAAATSPADHSLPQHRLGYDRTAAAPLNAGEEAEVDQRAPPQGGLNYAPRIAGVQGLSVGAERQAEKGHAVAFELGCDRGAVGVSGAGGGSEFLEERTPDAGREHDDQLGRLVGQVEECVG